jgi:hypothetical protein
MAIVLDGTTGITTPAENVSGTVTANALVGNGSGLTSITAATATTATNQSGGTVAATTITSSGTAKIGTTSTPTSFAMITASPLVIEGTGGEPFTYRCTTTTYSSNSSSQLPILQITIPAASHSVLIRGQYIGSRNYVEAANASTAQVGEFYMMIQRLGTGSNVVLDNNLGTKTWAATTTTAGGGIAKAALSPALSRAGAESATSPQVVNITAIVGGTGSQTAFVAVNWEILSHKNTITITPVA